MLRDLLRCQRALAQDVAERFTDDELHHERGLSAVLDDVEQRDDARMLDRRNRTRFGLEALARVAARVGCEHLQRDAPAQTRVARRVYGAHPTTPDFTFDDVAPCDFFADSHFGSFTRRAVISEAL